MQKEPKQPNKKEKRPLTNYAKYSAMGFQMAAIIVLGTLAGLKLDEYLALKTPIFTAVLSLLSVVAAIYFAIKDFLNEKK